MFLWKVFAFVLILLMERAGLDQIKNDRNYNSPSPYQTEVQDIVGCPLPADALYVREGKAGWSGGQRPV